MEREELLGLMIKTRDTYKNEIPKQMVHSGSDDALYKCRRGWFQSVIIAAEAAEDYADEDTKKEAAEFWNYLDRTGFKRRLTNDEDIRRGNHLLDTLITQLQGKSSGGMPELEFGRDWVFDKRGRQVVAG